MTCNVCGNEIPAGAGYVEGKDCYICSKCMEKLGRMWANTVGIEVWDEKSNETTGEQKPLMKPTEIKKFLDDYIIGQDEAKERISVAVYNHYKRIRNRSESSIEIVKNNMLCLGPSGSGKTLLAQTIAKLLDVPFVICDATTLTEAGYVGDDVESVLVKLYQAAGCDKQKTEQGIVFIDEIDKIARKGDNPSITRDVSGEGVQQGLLKMIEGSIVGIPPHGGRKHPDQDLVYIDTKDILFICAGAFEGIEKKIGQRYNQQAVGYTSQTKHLTDSELLSKVSSLDLRAYGLIPEIIGRLPVVTHTNELTESDLKQILTEPKNAVIKQYQELMKMDGIDLKFEDDALDLIVKHTIGNKTGARGLRNTMEDVMAKAMFELPSSGKTEYIVNKEEVERRLAA